MAMSREGFRRILELDYISKGIPFVAYWHQSGFGILRTGPVGYSVRGKAKVRRATKTTLDRWNKAVTKLRRSTFGEVLTVEYDGTTVTQSDTY